MESPRAERVCADPDRADDEERKQKRGEVRGEVVAVHLASRAPAGLAARACERWRRKEQEGKRQERRRCAHERAVEQDSGPYDASVPTTRAPRLGRDGN